MVRGNKLIWVLLSVIFQACQHPKCYKVGDFFPPFSKMEWIQSPPLKIQDLKNKVVLIRWWTDECIFCANSADALNEWYDRYHEQGLEILGIYHPKPLERQPTVEEVRSFANDKAFLFPIGLDMNWKNLEKVWLNCGEKPFTSVSFLLDRNGKIIYIHPGGEYHITKAEGHEQCCVEYNRIDSVIKVALNEPIIK